MKHFISGIILFYYEINNKVIYYLLCMSICNVMHHLTRTKHSSDMQQMHNKTPDKYKSGIMIDK